jgi:hypothetical protein
MSKTTADVGSGAAGRRRSALRGGVIAVALALGACGDGDAPCGGDFCVPTLTVKWTFNDQAIPEFSGDNCTDLGIRTVEVDLSGAGGEFHATEQCSFRQVVFAGIPPGAYDVQLRPLDVDGELVTRDVVLRQLMFDGGLREESVMNVEPNDWAGSHPGTFFFRLRWDGQDCSTASPPVAHHVLALTMSQEKVPLQMTTTAGDPIDGSAPGACQSFTQMFPQSVLEAPFGFATFQVVGLDSTGTRYFEQTFETFVGAGLSNPEMVFDVASLGGLPDAGVSDATPSSDGA